MPKLSVDTMQWTRWESAGDAVEGQVVAGSQVWTKLWGQEEPGPDEWSGTWMIARYRQMERWIDRRSIEKATSTAETEPRRAPGTIRSLPVRDLMHTLDREMTVRWGLPHLSIFVLLFSGCRSKDHILSLECCFWSQDWSAWYDFNTHLSSASS